MTSMKYLVVAVGALLALLVMLEAGPMIGESINIAWTPDAQVKATGTLTFTDQPLDGETFNISTDRYEYDTGDGVAAGNLKITVAASLASTMGATVTEVTANDTTGVGATNTSTTVVFTADSYGYAGNSITTTETSTKASFGAATLTGGDDGSQYNSTINTDLTTGASFWTTMTSMTKIGAMVIIICAAVLVGIMRYTRS